MPFQGFHLCQPKPGRPQVWLAPIQAPNCVTQEWDSECGEHHAAYQMAVLGLSQCTARTVGTIPEHHVYMLKLPLWVFPLRSAQLVQHTIDAEAVPRMPAERSLLPGIAASRLVLTGFLPRL